MSGVVLVIGGGVHGLIAATYLARAGKHVTLLEAQDHLGGFCAPLSVGEGFAVSPGAQTLYALDPRVIPDLKLAKHGLKFAVRDMALVGLHGDGKHVALQRDVHATAANIAVHSAEDARAWPNFRRELFDLARAMRPLWWGEGVPPSAEAMHRVERIAKTGATAWLDSWFESDALKTALCFDATDGGLSPIEPGSALTLVWRAAQEISGLQGAVAVAGETLAESLVAAARTAGVDIQTGARVTGLLSDGETVTGVQLENGDTRAASQIVCGLSRNEVLQSMAPPLASGIARTTRYAAESAMVGEARMLLVLRNPLRFGGIATPTDARFILSESSGALARADFAARAGRLADELPMEIVISPTHDSQSVVSLLLRPVPANPRDGWQSFKPKLVERAIQTLERFAPGTTASIMAVKIFAPDSAGGHHYRDAINVDRLLAGYETRIRSPLQGLLFCGAHAEPVPAVSGRAARLAAAMLTGRR
jgi:phytoene dehydrogenase-like protein